jgi:hypothetical protein
MKDVHRTSAALPYGARHEALGIVSVFGLQTFARVIYECFGQAKRCCQDRDNSTVGRNKG